MKNLVLLAAVVQATPDTFEMFEGFLVGAFGYDEQTIVGGNLQFCAEDFKTTLVDVILGLFIPEFGDIKVDGVSVYSDLRSWQNMLCYVPQSIFLIDDTLERNIAYGVADHLIDQNKLKKAIAMAQLGEVVEQLPDGVKTIIGERGVLLSGGQRQRVGIARVLYHEREILVFDEATAALDTETEHLITEATKALAGSKTIIIIAHRLSTIEHCDCIYQLEQGRILKSGSYQEVIVGR